MRTFLTGATGFIGRPLARVLMGRGWEVAALVRRVDGPAARALRGMGSRLVHGDVRDPETMRPVMAGCDLVIHNAAWYELGVGRRARATMRAINVDGTANVLGLAAELGIQRVVHVSSTVYFGATGPEPRDESYRRERPYLSYYERTKAEAHELAVQYQAAGLPVVIVCPNAVVGPNDHSPFGLVLRMYLNHVMAPFAWGPDIVVSAVHVDDVAHGIALAAERGVPGETYILAGEPTSRRAFTQLWMTRPGGARIRFYIPTWLALLLFTPLAPLERALGLPAFLSRETVMSSTCLNYSGAKAQRELGWTYRPAREMWLQIVDEELRLLARRRGRGLLSRLKPVDPTPGAGPGGDAAGEAPDRDHLAPPPNEREPASSAARE